ncbi:hypothetical protein PRIPAC_91488 [Pristionchus pacificus]|uniref:Uncharacterized protein n=1 Tax=Pristionchus pacificus TaxID=54126 RepID=A0A2A6BAU9_PRIPA|nr:hypothetical protein PRIPAC_91488 [Pristionchus pacificus]|eukprot:PDM62998.1 hypothetical protein PRIPAC_50213 [Pristionchus pacificus]
MPKNVRGQLFLFFFLLLFNFALSSSSDSITIFNATSTMLTNSQYNSTSVDAIIENIFETYLPLVTVLSTLTANETAELAHQSLRHLKEDIDSLRISSTNNDSLLLQIEEGQMTEIVSILKDYHKSRVYSVISALWEGSLDSQIPRLDQFAILEYYEEKRRRQQREASIFSRIWSAIKKLFNQESSNRESCPADDPPAVRFIVDTFPIEKRTELDSAVKSNDSSLLVDLIEETVPDAGVLEELRQWRENITIPEPLKRIIDSSTEPQRVALTRLRELKLINSLRDYYGTLIERRSKEEQEEIRAFFSRMSDAFLGCYSYSEDHNEYWKYEY